jgi:SagB-type dehydrogenase family enzyme
MKIKFVFIIIAFITLFLYIRRINAMAEQEKESIGLPFPRNKSAVSVEEAISLRSSIREYKDEALTQEEMSQLLWAAQGMMQRKSGRTAPSAGALYPLEIYLVVSKVKSLGPGVYHYRPQEHSLVKIESGDRRSALFNASLRQSPIKNAPVSLVICAKYQRTTQKYGERGSRYVYIEVGHVGQNIYLQAEALGLATVAIGAFDDEAVKKVLGVKEEPIYIMPLGRPVE